MAGVQAKKRKTSTLEVMCRIRPYDGDHPSVAIIDEEKVRLVPPPDAPLNRHGEPRTESVYKFAHVFEPYESQRAVFEQSALDFVENLVNGQNSLLFTYGVTGSGKTFTMTGTGVGDNSGIIPRSVDVLFNSIKNQADKCVFAPNGRNGFYVRAPEEAWLAREHYPAEYSISERIIESKKVYGFRNDMMCSVFISYVEIYNDQCYDLFDSALGQNRLNMTKNIRSDANGVNYVEKVVEVEVTSSDEVLEEYLKAQERRSFAKTVLNDNSSRSHSVFTIKLVQAPIDESLTDTTHPVSDESKIVVSQLSLVDLAGSERSKRTENQGQRLVEAGKINQSLLVLRRCFEQLRENQKRPGNPQPVNYRDQKLTYLFKSYFEGNGRIRMIVCVNPRPKDYEENIFVMSFAELAQDVDIPESATPVPLLLDMTNQRYSRREVNKWYMELDTRLAQISSRMDIFKKPPPIQLRDMDDEDSIIRLREYYTEAERTRSGQISVLKTNEADLKKIMLERLCSADLDRRLVDEREQEIDELRECNSSISKERNRLRREVNKLQVKLSKYESEFLNQRRRDEDERRRQMEQNEALMKQRETMKTIVAGLNVPPSAPSSSGGRVAALTTMFSSEQENRPPVPSKTKQYVRGPGGQYNPANALVNRGRGVANIRYGKAQRRSRSLGVGGRVLNHQPLNKIPTGTVFQAEFPNNTKHTTKVKPQDLKGCTDYVITNQNVDDGGNLCTQHFKGDIVPTAAGGHAVMFRDVERLTQESP
uniref:Kinesin-like protein n=1 Tax=Bursaphelenchus xylophilus TaxID=6326 RepID=A0A1I7S3T9_BURXY